MVEGLEIRSTPSAIHSQELLTPLARRKVEARVMWQRRVFRHLRHSRRRIPRFEKLRRDDVAAGGVRQFLIGRVPIQFRLIDHFQLTGEHGDAASVHVAFQNENVAHAARNPQGVADDKQRRHSLRLARLVRWRVNDDRTVGGRDVFLQRSRPGSTSQHRPRVQRRRRRRLDEIFG